jgi:hypothetical protein
MLGVELAGRRAQWNRELWIAPAPQTGPRAKELARPPGSVSVSAAILAMTIGRCLRGAM